MPTNNPTPGRIGNAREDEKLHGRSDEQPGYETTDVNIQGIIVFLGGLCGFLLVFFLFCFGMGRVINNALEKNDGPVSKWNQLSSFAGAATTGGKRQDLANNPEMQQQAHRQMIAAFPSPRLDVDDGNQATADLHAREDLLLDHYSTSAGQPRTIRIPIEQAMETIAKKGLPVAAAGPTPATQLAEDQKTGIQMPLTIGFARTSYELDVMEARAQKMSYGKAEGSEHAELKGVK